MGLSEEEERVKAMFRGGHQRQAIDRCRALITEHPDQVSLKKLASKLYFLINQPSDALAYLRDALSLQPGEQELLFNEGVVLRSLQEFEAAIKSFSDYCNLFPDDPAGWMNLAECLYQAKDLDTAADAITHCLRLESDLAEPWTMAGLIASKQNQIDIALRNFDRAIEIDPNYAKAYANKGLLLFEQKYYKEALSCLDKAVTLNSTAFEPWLNKGLALHEICRFDDALAHFDQALKLNPQSAQALAGKGLALSATHRYEEALLHLTRAINIDPQSASIHLNRGETLDLLERTEEALDEYRHCVSLNRDTKWALGQLMHGELKHGNWENFEKNLADCCEGVLQGKLVCNPFLLLSAIDDPALHLKCANGYANFLRAPYNQTITPIESEISSKIKIGYFSADFRNHAVSSLVVEVLEKHDRSRFEIYGFGFGPKTNDEMRTRVVKAFDTFYDVRDLSDDELAALSKKIGIHIAIDLTGFTQFSRTEIFALRCAPIQVNYLGYPGTLGADFFDYIIADRILIPDESRPYYSEKIVYLPDSYQANDSQRKVSNAAIDRVSHGLPEDAFVFCCFNNVFKILPETFLIWLDILRAVDASVLWLLDDNSISKTNFRHQAQSRGVDPERLIFAPRMARDQHIARYQLADLFLDTFPYGAHTTASDALWVGLPVLTRTGKSFASRVAASLLHAVDASQLITQSPDEYRNLAIKLGSDSSSLQEVRRNLLTARSENRLFDSDRFTRNIEMAYTEMFDRRLKGLSPDDIYIAPGK